MRALLPFIKLFKHQWLMMLIGLFLSVATLMAGIGLLLVITYDLHLV